MTRFQLPLVRRCSLSASLLFLASFALTGLASAQTTPETSSSAATQAQEPADPNPGAISTSGGMDIQSTYMFRGIRQNSTGIAAWPWVDLGFAAYAGDGAVKSVGINVGSWNSQHTGDTGADGPSQKIWYESDFYTTLGFGFGGGVSLATTYTAYTSPNNTFTTVKELMFKFAIDDSARFGKAAFKPYAIVARELDAEPASVRPTAAQSGHLLRDGDRAGLRLPEGQHCRAGQGGPQPGQLLRGGRHRRDVRLPERRRDRHGAARLGARSTGPGTSTAARSTRSSARTPPPSTAGIGQPRRSAQSGHRASRTLHRSRTKNVGFWMDTTFLSYWTDWPSNLLNTPCAEPASTVRPAN